VVSEAQAGVRVREWLRRPVVLGTLAAVATALVGVTAVLVAADLLDRDDASAARRPHVATAAESRRHERRTTTTTTRPAATTTTVAPAGVLPATGGATPPTTAAPDPADDAPDPPDPADAFQPGPVAPGISVSIGSCTWSPAAGGTLRATGTMTYSGTEDTFWDLTISWLVDNQGQTEELDSENDVYDLTAGQTVSWDLTITTDQPTPPRDLSCAYSVQ
jgi:hypothetical protein